MDLTLVNTASAIKQAKTSQAIQTSVARKVLDSEQQQGQAALQLIAAASGKAGPGDALAAQATGLGGQVDVYG
jgi:hypothetical protein